MPNRFAAFGWSIDVAQGWIAEIRQETAFGETSAFLAIVPESNDALLRLTPDERCIVGAGEWVEKVGVINRAKGRRVSFSQCGDFVGNYVEFGSAGEWLRGWALCSNSIPLDATYRCEIGDVSRHDQVVDRMLDTLRLEKSSA
jgi:hypothetical protein